MSLQEIRGALDQLDTQMVDLFVQRMTLCGQVAEIKKGTGQKVLDGAREREVLARVGRQAGEALDPYARMLYTVMMDVSRAWQTALIGGETALTRQIRAAMADTPAQFPRRGTVACQGIEGSYAQMACDRLFAAPDIMYFRTFENVFQAVEQGLCEFGILPIENSSNGSVRGVYDLMRHYRFSIVRSVRLHIDHQLMALPGASLSDIREVVSHEQAIGQCSRFLSQHPEIKVILCENTATAAKLVTDSGRSDLAAICSRRCAGLYGLQSIESHVQNSENNYTRFICIAKDLAIYPGADHVSLMLSVEHTPGALYRMIARFAALGVNLTKLESRPVPGSDFEFLFYFELEASVWSEDVLHLLGDCSASDDLFAFLGSYSEVR